MPTTPIIESKEYANIHGWLRRNYGVPRMCESDSCVGTSKVYDWAKKRGVEHARNRNHYLRLCRKCHILYDWDENKTKRLFDISHTNKSNKKRSRTLAGVQKTWDVGGLARMFYSKEVLKIRDGEIVERYSSITEAAKVNGVDLNAISLILRGINKYNRAGDTYVYGKPAKVITKHASNHK